MKVGIVLQGPIYKFSSEVFFHYYSIPIIDQIVVSCWDTDNTDFIPKLDRVKVVRSNQRSILKCGGGNVNYQIQTSSEGIKACDCDIIFKIRTDQQILDSDIIKLKDYFLANGAISELGGKHPKGKIVCGSIFTEFPYHPRDHFYLGYKEDMVALFDLPFSNQDFLIPDTINGIRPEAYIGVYYCSKYDTLSALHALDPHTYLTDNAALKQQALDNSENILYKLFLTSPLISHIWKKHGIFQYQPLWSPTYKEYRSDRW